MELQLIATRCTVQGCQGLVRSQPNGSLACAECGVHVTVWRVPRLNQAIRGLVSPALRRAMFSSALLLLALTGTFIAHSAVKHAEASELPAPQRVAANFDSEAFLMALRSGDFTLLEELPASYADARQFTAARQHEANNSYLAFWQTRNRAQRMEILLLCIQAAHPALLPFLAEITWHTIAHENDFGVATAMSSALHACSEQYVDFAIFCMEHIASESTFTGVVHDAQAAIDGLRYRVRVYGR